MKRFTETTKWAKDWFQGLSPTLKCLWMYVCDNADAAGVWDANFRLASFQIGEQVSEKDFEHFDGRINKLSDKKFHVLPFLDFQYGKLSKECKAHIPVFREIEKHSLCIGYAKASESLQETEEETEVKGNSKGELAMHQPLFKDAEFSAAFQEFEAHCHEIKKPLSSVVRSQILTDCSRAGEKRSVKVIRHTLSKNWKSLIWDFDANGKNGNGTKKDPMEGFKIV